MVFHRFRFAHFPSLMRIDVVVRSSLVVFLVGLVSACVTTSDINIGTPSQPTGIGPVDLGASPATRPTESGPIAVLGTTSAGPSVKPSGLTIRKSSDPSSDESPSLPPIMVGSPVAPNGIGAVLGAALGSSFASRNRVIGAVTGSAVPSPADRPSTFLQFEAPRQVTSGQTFALQVAFRSEGGTPDVRITPGTGTSLAPGNRLSPNVPPELDRWPIDVVLTAPGFDVVDKGTNTARLTLMRAGTSEPAMFRLAALDGTKGVRTLSLTLWYRGGYLATVDRAIEVVHAPSNVGRTATPLLAPGRAPYQAAPQRLPTTPVVADLTLVVRQESVGGAARVQLQMHSPHLSTPIVVQQELTSDALRWLEMWTASIKAAGRSRSVTVGDGAVSTPASGRARAIAELQGLGADLYRRFAPELLKEVIMVLSGREQLRSIQIFTNQPAFPWELMHLGAEADDDGGFLGTRFEVARWHLDGGPGRLDVPVRSLRLDEVVVVAPRYRGADALPAQREEVDFLRRRAGFRLAGGRLADVLAIARTPPQGIVHFAGHGEMTRGKALGREYLLRLEDESLDMRAWRGVASRERSARSLFFLNACELGATDEVAGYAAGWAPAMLDAGAAGFIGGLWAVNDRAAARFAKRFYDALDSGAPEDAGNAARAVQAARRQFFETGDPTYLGYVFYGNVNLRLSR